MARVGIVAIGRNEGERLRGCLQSLQPLACPAVYVDSGSTDGSRELAQSFGVEVVLLDLSIPFTAARARNAGFQRLHELAPEIEFVQFLDGDCTLDPNWLATAMEALNADPAIAVVCGRRRERFPNASVYNRLCDLEWDTPVGEALACGGDALMRTSAFLAVGGYRDDLIAGEEPELCARLRKRGLRISRLDAEMTLHDAAMMRFRQWWSRNVRAGHAFAEVSRLHPPFWRRETRSNWFWGLCVPLASLALPLLLLLYLRLYRKVRRARYASGDSPKHARLYARYCVLSKFPQVWGQIRFHRNRLLGRKNTLIEYKQPRNSG